jgi:hypothetical protein
MANAPHSGRSHSERGATLEPGDVVFYRPAGVDRFVDLDPNDFDTAFPVVAAFAQALPYVLLGDGDLWSSDPKRFKPWHHVSIFVDDGRDGPQEIGFGPATYDGISDGEVDTANPAALMRRPLGLNGAFDFDVLRAPTPELGAAIVAASEAQVGTEADDGVIYSTNGLLAFAFATKARMLPDSPARTKA